RAAGRSHNAAAQPRSRRACTKATDRLFDLLYGLTDAEIFLVEQARSVPRSHHYLSGGTMSDDAVNNRALFEIYNRNLQKLEEQQALLGFNLALTNQIDQTQKELTRINREYAEITAVYAPGSPQT